MTEQPKKNGWRAPQSPLPGPAPRYRASDDDVCATILAGFDREELPVFDVYRDRDAETGEGVLRVMVRGDESPYMRRRLEKAYNVLKPEGLDLPMYLMWVPLPY